MQIISDDNVCKTKVINFGCTAVDTVTEIVIFIKNNYDKPLTYKVSLTYNLDNIDRVFKLYVSPAPVNSGNSAEITILYHPNNPRQSYTEYYMIDDSEHNTYRLTVTGTCFGPEVSLSLRKIRFMICKNVSETEQRREIVKIVNNSSIDATYQWMLPVGGQGFFQITTGNCGVVRAHETISATMLFTGTALGMYTAELVCLVVNQEPLFLNAIATVFLPGNTMFNINKHVFQKRFLHPTLHLLENSLTKLPYVPPASVFDRHLDFGLGSVSDVTLNISQTLCVTNHEQDDGFLQWCPDTDNIFMVDPIASVIPPNESRLFTLRFRPKRINEGYGHLLCGDYQHKRYSNEDEENVKFRHTWFRIPCVGNTWAPCSEWPAEWDCPLEIVLPPTVPARTTFINFMLSNKIETPMYFRFRAPDGTNFVVMPMCGIVAGRGWQIVTVALEPLSVGDYFENWDLSINQEEVTRISFVGSAEVSKVEVLSHCISPAVHDLFEFPPTVTGCTNYCTTYIHNLTRMEVHIRVLNSVSWLGADNSGTIVLSPKEIVRYRWWFFPQEHDKVYVSMVTCTCACLIDGRPVAEPNEVIFRMTGFSELPDVRFLPKTTNLHDVVVGERATCKAILYNNCSCYFTSNLYHVIDGMDDDFSGDTFEINSSINSLKPSQHCEVEFTLCPNGAGPRQIDIKYTVLFRTEFDEIEEIQPITKTICKIWYDGIYPTVKVKRTISVKCPVILSNHCVWNIINVNEFNKALVDCRPNKPLEVNLYAPDLCVQSSQVEMILVLGCVYNVPVPWTLRRKKICDCEMVEVQLAISWYTMKHACIHRPLVELMPMNGVVTPEEPGLLYLKFNYSHEGQNTLCYVLTLPNDRSIILYINVFAHRNSKGILTPLRRVIGMPEYLAVMDCGRVPINNLDPVIRIVWLYNPTEVFTTWRLLRGNTVNPGSAIKCLLYFAEVPPLGKLAIPFGFMPTEMIDYEVVFLCSFGYDTVKILVKGQGGLPNCVETRMDIPYYTEKLVRSCYRENVVYLSKEHFTIPIIPTHSLSRDIIAICNDTDHVMRFIWLPERIANIVNVVITPCWGVLQPRKSEWITMTVYTLQEPATFTTNVACEILDLTVRKKYQKNELLRKNKMEKCHQEFIITEHGYSHPGINDFPPYVLDLEAPQPYYLAITVSVSSQGQLDGYPRMLLRQQWEQTPAYDLLSSDLKDSVGRNPNNNVPVADIIRIIDGILWDALHSKMFKYQINFYAKERIPTYEKLVKVIESEIKPRLSRRVTSGICDAIVNKAVFNVYNLISKHDGCVMLEAE